MTMALTILGKTPCVLCGSTIQERERTVSFPPLVPNQLDPLYVFNDTAMHEDCFQRHPLAEAASLRYREMLDKTGPGSHRCLACAKPIDNPDDLVVFGHLTADRSHPLFSYNYLQFHRGCLRAWPQRGRVLDLLYDLRERWRGPALDWLIKQMA
jgi:predicted nucleic acid-binding Zn ribbon protein